MNKKTLIFLGWLIPFLIFNIIFFIVCGVNNYASVWLSYAFINVSYLIFLILSFFNKSNKGNKVFAFSIISIAIIYCILELVVGLVFIILKLESINISLYVQLPLLGIFLVLIIVNTIFNKNTEINEKERQNEISFIRKCTLDFDLIITKISDNETIRNLQNTKELVSASPDKTYAQVKEIEDEILSIIDKIDKSASTDIELTNKLINELMNRLKRRNLIIQSLH